MKNQIHLGVSGILVSPKGKILLGKRSAGDDAFPGYYCTPGGGVEFGESTAQALEREFMEETELRVRCCELICLAENFRPEHHTVMPFYQVIVIGKLRPVPLDGFDECVWWGREEIIARFKELTPITAKALKLFLSIPDTNYK